MHRLRSIACGKRMRMMGLTLLTGMLAATIASAAGRPDGMIKDCSSDIGNEPNAQCGAFYASPDIVVRNSPGFVPVHQQPISGQPNWVYATVTNIGTSPLTDGVVHFYFAKASTGLFWSSSWINNFIGAIVYGDEIGSIAVPALAPGATANVGVKWTTVPNPADYSDPDARHFCLLARLVSQQDPMTYTEGTSIPVNTQNNNNIAWKNCSIMDPVKPTGAIDIQADDDHDGKTELRFTAPQVDGGNALDHVKIRVDLGQELFEIWKAGGNDGQGVTTVDDAEHTIEVNEADARIGGLNLAHGTRYTAHVQIVFPQEVDPDLAGRVFEWNIEQVRAEDGEQVGGEQYQIELPHDNRHPDAMIKDCLADVGGEPNSACYAFYASPSIWVRNTQGAVPGHQSPIAGQTNWVYVTITNIGTSTLNYGDLHLYFAKASTGLYWSSSWINDILPSCLGGGGSTVYGDEIGSQPITSLLPGETRDIEFAWNTVPNPADFCDPDARHFCLMARFVSAEDPMTYPEGIWIGPNVQNNNNIAWKNCSILDAQHPHGTVDIKKSPAFAGNTKLRFDVPEGEGEGNVLDHAQIQVDLGAKLYDTWKAAGEPGEGVDGVGGENGTININDPHAWVGGLQLPDDVRLSIRVNVNYPADVDLAIAGTTFHWDIAQFNEETDELVGGERYDVVMPGDAPGKGMLINGKADIASALKLMAHPNPTTSSTTIGFTLPSAGKISVAIYDASGRLVRQLLNGADRAAGDQQMVWNGQSVDGKRVPSGTYICRVSTSMGAAEQQIKVMR